MQRLRSLEDRCRSVNLPTGRKNRCQASAVLRIVHKTPLNAGDTGLKNRLKCSFWLSGPRVRCTSSRCGEQAAGRSYRQLMRPLPASDFLTDTTYATHSPAWPLSALPPHPLSCRPGRADAVGRRQPRAWQGRQAPGSRPPRYTRHPPRHQLTQRCLLAPTLVDHGLQEHLPGLVAGAHHGARRDIAGAGWGWGGGVCARRAGALCSAQ